MRIRLWVVLLGALFTAPVSALEVAGVILPDQVALTTDQPLALNGAGVRRKFFIKVYVGALYLPVSARTEAAVLAQAGPRRMLMHILYSEIEAAKLVDGWNDGFSANLSDSELAALQPRIAQFNTLFVTVHEGDVILLDYLPTQGTSVTIRGQLKGIVPGQDFNDALLRIWLGDKPADSGLKDALLGIE